MISDNGWPGIEDRAKTRLSTVPGTDLKLRTAYSAAWVLSTFAGEFHKRVESLTGGQLDDWSYAWRNVRGSQTRLSCHASGTAIDLNALKHPRGVRGTFSAAQVKEIRKILAEFSDPANGQSVLKWGADFGSASIPDEMHFQIRGDKDALRRVQLKLTALAEEEDDVSFKDKHVLTDKDVEAYGQAELVAGKSEKSYDEIVRFAPAVARLRREMNERLDRIEQAIEALNKK